VKELLKSVHICQSYRKTKSGTFFMAHGVYILEMLISVHMCQKLWKLVGSRQSYCNNNQQLTLFWATLYNGRKHAPRSKMRQPFGWLSMIFQDPWLSRPGKFKFEIPLLSRICMHVDLDIFGFQSLSLSNEINILLPSQFMWLIAE